ncbi:hypothetical protein FI667_g6650, partial [Globisporangium splendens]
MEWGSKPSSYQAPSLLNLTPQRQQQQQSQCCSHQFDDDDEQAHLCKVEHEEDDPQDSVALTRSSSNSNSYFTDRYPGIDGGGSGFVSGHSRHLTDMPPFGFQSSATGPSHHQSLQGSTPMAMEGLHGNNNNNGNAHFTSAHVLDLQNFDDSASVDLQQLFPQPPVGAVMMSTNSTLQALHQSQQLASYYATTTAVAQGYHQTPSTEFFSENFQSPFHADPSQAGLPPFSSNNPSQQPSPSMFDDRDEIVMPEMHEVSNLFGNASLMTPPMSIITPRTSIVSPMNGGFLPPRSALVAGNNANAPTIANNSAMTTIREGSDSSMTVETSPKFSPDRRKLCCIEGCKSQARAFNRCKRHGGSKRCSHPGCTKSVQSRGLCIRHGGGSRCQESGCTRAAQSHGRCKMHGGGRPCIVAGCEKKAHLKRLCRKHGGGAKCCLEDCDKWAQRQGMCMTHSKHASPTTTSRGASLRVKKDNSAASTAAATASTSTTDAMEMMTQLYGFYGYELVDYVRILRHFAKFEFWSRVHEVVEHLKFVCKWRERYIFQVNRSLISKFKFAFGALERPHRIASLEAARWKPKEGARALHEGLHIEIVNMLEQPSRYMRHDAETFRVAEELMMLSNCVVVSGVSASPTEPHLDKLQEFSGRMGEVRGESDYLECMCGYDRLDAG